MALSGLEIFKKLPKTNCGECGVPTCLAFAMKLAATQAEIEACPYVSEDMKAELAEASAPPIRGVTIGVGERAVKVGEEQVLYRHDKTFYNPTAIALLINDTSSDQEIQEKVSAFKSLKFDRVGQLLQPDLLAVKAGSDAARFGQVISNLAGEGIPLVLIADNPDAMKAGAEAAAGKKPLLHAAGDTNFEQMAEIAKEQGAALAIKASGVEALEGLSKKVAAVGLKDLVLDTSPANAKDNLRDQVFMRRAALVKKNQALGFPTIMFPCDMAEDHRTETLLAATGICKYASIVVLSHLEPENALPLMVLRQNIYTDPQRPMVVEEKVYPLGNPDENSPVLVTTNFALTYFTVSGEIEASKQPAWLCIMDVEGLSVLTAWAAGKFTSDKIAPFVRKIGISEKVKHRKLIIPGYVSQLSGELEDELSGEWKIEVGPREAGDLPGFLRNWNSN